MNNVSHITGNKLVCKDLLNTNSKTNVKPKSRIKIKIQRFYDFKWGINKIVNIRRFKISQFTNVRKKDFNSLGILSLSLFTSLLIKDIYRAIYRYRLYDSI